MGRWILAGWSGIDHPDHCHRLRLMQIVHVRIACMGLAASARWDLDHHRVFVEKGELAGARFLTPTAPGGTGFIGVEFQQSGPPTSYERGQL